MNAERDPRVDPKAGDEVAAWTLDNPARHRIVSVVDGVVTYEITGRGYYDENQCRIQEWRDWASNTDVARVAEGRQP